VIQPYHVPPPKADQYQLHDEAVYSLWNYFTSYCSGLTSVPGLKNESNNEFTGKPRLKLFQLLAEGRSATNILPLGLSVPLHAQSLDEFRHSPYAEVMLQDREFSPNPIESPIIFLSSERDDVSSRGSMEGEVDFTTCSLSYDNLPNGSPQSITSTMRLSPELSMSLPTFTKHNSISPVPTCAVTATTNDSDIFLEMRRCVERYHELDHMRAVKAKQIEFWKSEARATIPFPKIETEPLFKIESFLSVKSLRIES